jgi:hypothetical protein
MLRYADMRRLTLCTTLIALSGLAYACGSAELSSFGADSASGGAAADAGSATLDPSAGGKPAALGPVDNAVILVHAAKSQAFRLCFESELDRRPQPDSQVMPQANVVGVEVGSAVRIGPLSGAPGQIYLFEEPLIRASYPQFGGAGVGPTCRQLLASQQLGKLAIPLGAVTTDLSHGVHLLVARGCPANTPGNTYSAAECGAGWDAAKGNLGVTELTLSGSVRADNNTLPTQVVNLSQALESERAGRQVAVTFGDLTAAGAGLASVVTDPPLFGAPAPSVPANLSYASSDLAIYESVGFRVQLTGPGGDGGAPAHLVDESLARIQKLSSPLDLPPTYYAAASNYALLMLGDPNAAPPDGGAGDDRRSLHFLAVPVIAPKGDAGADGGDAAAP